MYCEKLVNLRRLKHRRDTSKFIGSLISDSGELVGGFDMASLGIDPTTGNLTTSPRGGGGGGGGNPMVGGGANPYQFHRMGTNPMSALDATGGYSTPRGGTPNHRTPQAQGQAQGTGVQGGPQSRFN